jgi:hypothetical protein
MYSYRPICTVTGQYTNKNNIKDNKEDTQLAATITVY